MYKLIAPRARFETISQVSPLYLKKNGMKGIILDLDNTIIAWDAPELSAETAGLIKNFLAMGLKITILSNNRKKRTASIAGPMSLPYVANAAKPLGFGFRKALRLMGLAPGEVAVIGDQLFTDVLGGNLLGLYTIWVNPISQKEFVTTKLNRKLEKIAVRILVNKGLLK